MITQQPLLLKLQRKLLFFIIIIFQSETCCKTTLVTRYFSGKVSCHAIKLFIDCEHRCLTPCKLHSCSLTEFFFLILDLYFMTKWRSLSLKYRRGFDLFANMVKIQQKTRRRCSYFQFVSFGLSNRSKFP